MFKKGNYIIYGVNGVCQVHDITTMEEASDKDKLYYQLIPVHSEGNVIYTPVDNQKVVMRPVLTREEAEQLIDSIPEIEQMQEVGYKLREQQFKEAMKTCDCIQWVRVIKTSWLRKQERIQEGKKVTAADEKFLKAAETNLYEELSVVMNKQPEEIQQYIAKRIGMA